MGTFFQSLVFNVPADQAPSALARHIRNYLFAEEVIATEQSEGALGSRGLSYAPGPAYEKAVDVPNPHLFSAITVGVEIAEGRFVEMDPHGSFTATCPRCAEAFAPGEAFYDAIASWHEGVDDTTVACPHCVHRVRLVNWPIRPVWGFGNLVIKFWNWPMLRPQFIEVLASVAGLQPIVVNGKL